MSERAADEYESTEISDGMRITRNVPITMRDGVVLRADVFGPVEGGSYPTVLSYGCYAKGLSFQEAYAAQWEVMVRDFPEIMQGTSNKYQCWEAVDPERWVPDGYVVVRVDSRGAGWSEGVQNVWSTEEVDDYYECIEWAAKQAWCNGNVGLLGISYYASNQWLVASRQPPSLKAIIPWEGTADLYRELFYHGGIRSQMLDAWYPRQYPMQYGYGERARKNPITGDSVAGPVTLGDEELRRNRIDKVGEVKAHPLDDDYYTGLKTDPSKVTVPLLSAANWGGQGLHLRGNIEAFSQAASENKWLEVHGLEHWTHFYSPYGVALQKRFFDHFLKGADNGWDSQPRVKLQVRHIEPGVTGSHVGRFVERDENAWPIERTQWTRYFLDAKDLSLLPQASHSEASAEYQASGDGLTFLSPPVTQDTEITGPLAAKLFIDSSTADADIFVVLRVFDANGDEVVFRGAMDAHTPVAQGWLRASHRRLDPARSLPHRPFHTHDAAEPLNPGEVYELDVEIWPTSVVLPAGYRLGLTVRGKDYEYKGPINKEAGAVHRYPSLGVGPFTHNDAADRPPDVFGGRVRVHTGGSRSSFLLLPIVPESGST